MAELPSWLPDEFEEGLRMRPAPSSCRRVPGLDAASGPRVRSSFYDAGRQAGLDSEYQPLSSRSQPEDRKEPVYENMPGDQDQAAIPGRDAVVWAREAYGGRHGEFNSPIDVACSDFHQRFVVADTGNYRLQVLSTDGKPLNHIGQGLIYPTGVAYDQNGRAFVTNCLTCSVGVVVLGVDGYQTGMWGQSTLAEPTGVACSESGQVIVSDNATKSVTVFSPEGRVVRTFASASKKLRQVSKPRQVVVDSKKRIILGDPGFSAIKIFDTQGKLLKEFDPADHRKSPFQNRQQGICVDGKDNILVALHHSHKVAKFSPDGDFMQNVLTRDDGIQYPVAICVGIRNIGLTESNKLNKHAAVKVLRLPP